HEPNAWNLSVHDKTGIGVHHHRNTQNFSFYLFSSHPTVNTAIKLCRVIKSLLSFLQEINYPKELVYKLKCSVYDNSVMVLENHKGSSLFIEKSYLLVLLKQLGKSFWLDENDLLKFVVPKDRSRSYISWL
ncbi:hypothetical protein, partial [Pseudoalteromonas tetraodonis]|uniref:hypothetical protein n=1 Tax=Pseudoalteromonas tetraodonis TaxID=43659 RepID=UPI0030016144